MDSSLSLSVAPAPADNELPVELSSFSTTLIGSLPARTHNIRLAVDALDGTVLEPGAVLSFNATVGPRSAERGFLDAPVILREERQLQLGGGICQVASTLFVAGLVAGLTPIERHRHSSPVDYIALGEDATIAWGYRDLKLRNDFEQRVRVRLDVIGSTLTARVEGEQGADAEFELEAGGPDIADLAEIPARPRGRAVPRAARRRAGRRPRVHPSRSLSLRAAALGVGGAVNRTMRPRRNGAPAARSIAIACIAWAALAAGAVTADELDAYRALATSPGRDAVLAFTRAALREYFENDGAVATAAPATPDSLVPDWPGAPTGLFLSLTRGASTRACVGTATPLAGTLAHHLRRLAAQVLTSDPRHPPVRAEDLDTLCVNVSFAGRPEPVADPMEVAPAREGLLITSARGSIAFLPGEARTVSWALREARRVGMLDRSGDASYQRFQVVALKDAPPVAHPVEHEATHDAR
jgi:AMMECR1 domain-containing protein